MRRNPHPGTRGRQRAQARTQGGRAQGRTRGRWAQAGRPVRRRRYAGVARYHGDARRRLQRYRRGSLLAVSLTALLLLVFAPEGAAAEVTGDDAPVAVDPASVGDASQALDQATGTLRDLLLSTYGMLPKVAIALGLIVLAWLLSWAVQWVLRHSLSSWSRIGAIAALVRIGIWLGTIAVALAILAGDVRALLGSVGLVGLALSWALQTPIESFTGWLLNSFRGYYRVGDRIEVGEVFGDVYRIDLLTTTVWEAGGPGKAVTGAQPTGAMITFPNWEVLRSNIINYSRDFPYVWDELAIGVANESDLPYCVEVIGGAARSLLGPGMEEPTAQYRGLLERAHLAFEIAQEPSVFLAQTDAWTVCTVRYLVHHRQRRRRSTDLLLAIHREIGDPRHAGRIISAYPRQELRLRREWGTAG